MKRSLLSLCALVLFHFTPLQAEQPTNAAIKFTDPEKPGTLKIRVGRGDVRITGSNVAEISVTTKSQPNDAKPRKDGLRVLGASAGFSLSEKDNVVTLDAGSPAGPRGDFTITVPKSTLISLSNSLGGDITCTDLSGDLEIKSLNGEVHLERTSGAAFVETVNGEIRADLPTLQAGKAYSFTSVNGEVRIRVPSETKANVRLRSQNGSILTDFDERALLTKVEVIPKKTGSRSTSTVGKRNSSRADSDDEVNVEVRQAVQEVIQATAEVAREAAVVARDALRVTADELRAQNGSRNNSDLAPVPPLPPLPPMTGGKIISGTLNGGGPEIQIATMNGDVVLQKSATKP